MAAEPFSVLKQREGEYLFFGEVYKMKKALKTAFLFFSIALLFCACGEAETFDMGLFVERYNKSSGLVLSFSDIIGTKNENGEEYSFSFPKNSETDKKILIKLFANESKKLYECRIIASKTDGKRKNDFSAEERERFIFAALCSLRGFSGFSEEKGKSALLRLGLGDEKTFSKAGERTHEDDGYCLVSLSNDLGFEVLIYNTRLKKIEETEKPESRPLFEETTKIRTETVPHK